MNGVHHTGNAFSKLSVTARVPFWALVFKLSYLPLQEPDKENKAAYSVGIAAIFLGILVFAVVLILIRKAFPLTAFLIGVLLGAATFAVSLIEL